MSVCVGEEWESDGEGKENSRSSFFGNSWMDKQRQTDRQIEKQEHAFTHILRANLMRTMDLAVKLERTRCQEVQVDPDCSPPIRRVMLSVVSLKIHAGTQAHADTRRHTQIHRHTQSHRISIL